MIYNCTSSTINPIKWDDFKRVLGEEIVKNPFANLMWYPGGKMHTSKSLHAFKVYLFHLFPAYVMDLFSYVIGKKPL